MATLVNFPEVTTNPNYRRQFGFGPNQTPAGLSIEKIMAARKAVPDESIGAKSNWYPKLPADAFGSTDYDFIDLARTYPRRITIKPSPIRPTKPTTTTDTPTRTSKAVDIVNKPIDPVRFGDKPIDEGMDTFKGNIIADKFDVLR